MKQKTPQLQYYERIYKEIAEQFGPRMGEIASAICSQRGDDPDDKFAARITQRLIVGRLSVVLNSYLSPRFTRDEEKWSREFGSSCFFAPACKIVEALYAAEQGEFAKYNKLPLSDPSITQNVKTIGHAYCQHPAVKYVLGRIREAHSQYKSK